MSDELVAQLLRTLEPELTSEELRWGSRWALGPLGVKTCGGSISPEAVNAGLLAKDNSLQPLLNRLAKEPNILKTIYLLLLSKSENIVSIRASHVLEKSEVILTRTNDPKIASIRISNLATFSFGYKITESDILQDLVYVMQGIDGRSIRFSDGGGVLEVVEAAVQPHVVAAIRVVGEMGVLVRRLNGAMLSVANPSGLLVVFFEAVKREMWEYQQIAALVDADLLNWTLVKLLAWVAVPVRKLRHLALTTSKAVKSASFVFNTSLFKSNYFSIAGKIEAFYLAAIAVWVTKGKLPPSGKWFFIEESSANSPLSSWTIWHDKFRIVPERVPAFLKNVEDLIFQTGKSTVFNSSFENVSDEKVFEKIENLKSDLLSLNSNQNLVVHVRDVSQLVDHVAAIRKYILLSEGAFASALVECVSVELGKPAEFQNKFELTHLVDLALREISSDSRFSDRVQVKLNFSAGPSGFDVFSLGYATTAPIDVVLTPDVMHTYGACFGQLFGLVRREASLVTSWKELAHVAKMNVTNSVATLLDKLHSLRSELWQFVHEYRAFCCYEIVQVNWQIFEREIQISKNLDQLIAAHQTYLSRIQKGLFCQAAALESCYAAVDRFTNSLPLIVAELGAAQLLRDEAIQNMENLIADIHDSFSREFAILGDLLRDGEKTEEELEFHNRLLAKLGQWAFV